MENPRSGTTDDVECMFSVMRVLTGKHFTLREVRYTWTKTCIEFAKRLEPNIGFFYFTSSHDRFYEGQRPDFSEKCDKSKNKRVRRREQPANLAYGRSTMPKPGARSTRNEISQSPFGTATSTRG